MVAARTKSPSRRVAAAALRACRRWAWGRTLSQALRLRKPWRYLMPVLLRHKGARYYELRGTGVHVLLRHGSSDITTFDEVFCSSAYEPPADVAACLAELGRPPRVVDLGANIGLFSAFGMGRWPGAQITAVEPDPESIAMLRACFARNRAGGDVAVVNAAAAASAGVMRFVAGLAAESHRAHPDEHAATVEVPMIDAFEHLAGADLVKIDIEGGEWELLGDARFATSGVRALVLEHHGRHCPTEDPRAAATRLLVGAGYEVRADTPSVRGVGLLWAWRPAQAAAEPASASS